MSDLLDILGQAAIEPRLNGAERDYLVAFAQSARGGRAGRGEDPYRVPANPAAEAPVPQRPGAGGPPRPAPGQPSLWCPWTPTPDGRLLIPSGSSARASVAWLRYLIRHFLASGGRAGRTGDARFERFTFDHVLSGTFVARWRRTGRMCLIRVRSNRVAATVLEEGDPAAESEVSLPYEQEVDRQRIARGRRRRVSTGSDLVCPDETRPSE